MFVNVGNKADVSGNDLLQYWEEDPATDLILLYLESFGNPRKFARLARRVARQKPIVAIKSGRNPTRAYTLQSVSDAVSGRDYANYATDALFRQAGVIRAETLEESFDIASVLTMQPLPEGNRVAIVTNASGLGVLCVDACTASGLVLPSLERGNPLELRLAARPEDYTAAVQQVLQNPDVDAVIVIGVPAGHCNRAGIGADAESNSPRGKQRERHRQASAELFSAPIRSAASTDRRDTRHKSRSQDGYQNDTASLSLS